MHSSLKVGTQGLSLAMNLFYKKWEQYNICLAASKLIFFRFLATEWVYIEKPRLPKTLLQPRLFQVTIKSKCVKV